MLRSRRRRWRTSHTLRFLQERLFEAVTEQGEVEIWVTSGSYPDILEEAEVAAGNGSVDVG